MSDTTTMTTSNTDDQKTGIFRYDKETMTGWIEGDDGRDYKVSSMFLFFQGYIRLDIFVERIIIEYSDDSSEIINLVNRWKAGVISSQEFYDTCNERFCF